MKLRNSLWNVLDLGSTLISDDLFCDSHSERRECLAVECWKKFKVISLPRESEFVGDRYPLFSSSFLGGGVPRPMVYSGTELYFEVIDTKSPPCIFTISIFVRKAWWPKMNLAPSLRHLRKMPESHPESVLEKTHVLYVEMVEILKKCFGNSSNHILNLFWRKCMFYT